MSNTKEFELKDNTGIVFKNSRKEKDTQPDVFGEIKIRGIVYKLAGWNKEGKKSKFVSLAFSEHKPGDNKAADVI